jgi:hypothetical protein
MKIAHDTRDFLIFDHMPWVAGTILTIFVALPLVAGIAAGINVILTGDISLVEAAMMIFGGAVFMFPFVLIIYALVRRRQVILDRRAGTVTLRRRTIFGYQQEIHALEDLGGAEIESQRLSERSSRLSHRALLLLGEQTRPVAPDFGGLATAQEQAERINAWLGMDREA